MKRGSLGSRLVWLVGCAAAACSAPEQRAVHAPTSAPLVAPGLRLPGTATPLAYDLELDVDPASEIVRGRVRIAVRVERPTEHVWLHGHRLDVTSAHWNDGKPARVELAGEQMLAVRFGQLVGPGELTLDLAFTARADGDQEGLFRQRKGAWYLFSQGQAVLARRFVPCFDEPRFKAPWRITLTVPAQLVALSNMPEQSTTAVAGARKRVVFAESPPLPSYLVAVAVGPFDLVDVGTVGRAQVPVRVAVRSGYGDHTGVVAARLPAVVDALERYLDEPLPFPKLDLVGVPEFFGAMENPGLVTFHEPMLIGNPKNQELANYFTFIAAHELAHQWFGNLVTPAWWDHLWLSEAFASWLGDRVVRELDAYTDPPLRFALARREAIEADRAGDVKPLWRHVRSTAEADEGFDAIAYTKGQLVLATFESFVGADAFREIVRDYVRAHRGRAVDSTDLIAALARAAQPGLARAFGHYATRRGTPVVEAALHCDATPTLALRARDGATPVCVRYGDGKAMTRACALVADTTELAVGATCPRVVQLNPDGAYYHSAWTTHGVRGPAPPVSELAPADRIIAGDDVAAAVYRGELPAADALAELSALAKARDQYGQLGALAIARALDVHVEDALRPGWTSWLAARLVERPLSMRSPGMLVTTDHGQQLLAVLPADRLDATRVRRAYAMLDKALPRVEGELPPAWVAMAAVQGGDTLFDRIVARARVLPDAARDALLAALGEMGPAQTARAVALVTSGDVPAASAWAAVARYFARPATRSAAWRAVEPKLSAIVARMPTEHVHEVITATSSLCDPVVRDEVAAAFASVVPTIRDGQRYLRATLRQIDACIARRARLGDFARALAAAR